MYARTDWWVLKFKAHHGKVKHISRLYVLRRCQLAVSLQLNLAQDVMDTSRGQTSTDQPPVRSLTYSAVGRAYLYKFETHVCSRLHQYLLICIHMYMQRNQEVQTEAEAVCMLRPRCWQEHTATPFTCTHTGTHTGEHINTTVKSSYIHRKLHLISRAHTWLGF